MNFVSLGVSGLLSNMGLTPADAALLLLLAGILLLYAEFNRPGTILLGASGALLFMLGVYEFLPLKFDPRFAALAFFGVALLLFELRFPPRSLHTLGAVASAGALILGLHNLIASPNGVHWAVAIFAGTVFSTVTYALGRIALLAARNKRLPKVHLAASNLKPHPATGGKSASAE